MSVTRKGTLLGQDDFEPGSDQPSSSKTSHDEKEEQEEQSEKGEILNYKMKPALEETFRASRLKLFIQDILSEKLQGKLYNVEDAGRWTREISDTVSAMVKEVMNLPRYKHVVQVTLGQQLGSGCRYIAKCCWDAESDSYTSDVYSNANLFCICTVFGVYLY